MDSSETETRGVLYVVATPIGNLGDLTLRAIETLKTASRIAAEDTRQTKKLLSHLGITGKPLDALHAHSTDRDVARAVDALLAGESIALVTDAGEIGEPGVDDRVKDAIGQIDKGNYGSGIDALTSLGAEADAREDVHRALIKAYTATNRPLLAMREIGAVVKANPNVDLVAPEGVTLRVEVRDTALQEGQPGADKAAVDEAFTLLNGRLGTVGEDDLYDIAYGKSGVNYTKARDRARSDIAKGDRAKMAPALSIAADLRNAGPSCNVRPLLDRASAAGDERALDILRPLVAPRMTSGHWRKTDSLGCIHDGSLTKTIADIDAHVRKH